MLHYNTVNKRTLELIKEIQGLQGFENLRLVGGTALALQIGHRISIDIDFFGNTNLNHLSIVDKLKKIGNLRTIRNSENVHIFLLDNIKVDIVNYDYPWIADTVTEKQIQLADLPDIAGMKISAITNRGTKKDFIDLYFLLQKYSFRQIIDFYLEKYKDATLLLTLKSLTYFTDADNEPMPKMLNDISWNDIKNTIILEVNNFI